MPRPTDDQILEYTNQFVEVMREDFERSFGLREFRIYVGAEFDFDAREMDDDLELAIIRRFDAHYDLARATFDMRWEFLDSYVEAQL
ncbi:hypothetical protein [Rhizobium favelukesii]|uniref:Uncharacterized protein n=1 Tax=Rhizobium favelukesii TaxID=348824 RepID=W6RSB9_9HYPH|nr:hypothetical protein [Rhizobium favelukesii]MCS0459956.1 hypothetical protein [Rhizobium favelukesii]CDM57216.1 hypothetical protein LPU83_1544 [Rhizobium favelukesii]